MNLRILILGCSAIHIDPEARHKREGINTPQKKERKSSGERERERERSSSLTPKSFNPTRFVSFFSSFFPSIYIEIQRSSTSGKKSLVTTSPRISYYTTFNSLSVLSFSWQKLKGIQNVSNNANKCYILSLKTHAPDYHS